MKKYHAITKNFLLSLTLGLLTGLTACTPKKADTDTAGDAVPQPQQVTKQGIPSKEGMVSLENNDVALTLDGVSFTWGEILNYLNSQDCIPQSNEIISTVSPKVNGLTDEQQKVVRLELYQLVRQHLLLKEAKTANMTITEEDRQHLLRRWQAQYPDANMTDMLSAIPVVPKSQLDISRDDFFLLLKWSDQLVNKIVVPEEMVQQSVSQMNSILGAFTQQIDAEKEDFAKLAENVDLYTDEGFAKLAKEISDGIESDNGGKIKEPMTRTEIAQANFDQPFDTPVGETSALIETPTSLRYIRVLEEIPSSMPGEPAKLRIAQILYSKKVLDNLPTEDEIRKDLQYQMQAQVIQDMLHDELADKYHFSCPLFPELLSKNQMTPQQPAPEEALPDTEEAEE